LILLNPGPVVLSERVRRALLQPDLCHREPEFSELQNRIRAQLLKVYDLDPEHWTAVLMSGSGTAAMEAMLTSVSPANSTVIVIENGVYGERLSRILRVHGITAVAVKHEWDAPIDFGALAACLEATRDVSHIAVVHHETTSGRLNELDGLASFCREAGVALLVDGVSSFGAEELAFERWAIDACAATANKCLHGVPGVSFVIARRAALQHAALPQRSVYLDLRTYGDAQDAGGTPFTQSVQCFYALAEALSEFHEEGGWRQRNQRYHKLAEQVREGLFELGIAPLLPPERSSEVLRAYRLPHGMSYADLHDALKRAGFVIYAGQGEFARSIFRVSTMGSITSEDMRRFVQATGEILNARSD